jgi:hypothetical protein
MDNENEGELPNIKNTGMVAAGISIAVISFIVLQHNLAFRKNGTVVIPAGGSYLGPTVSPIQTPAQITVAPTPVPTGTASKPTANGNFTTAAGKFGVTKDATWVTLKGNKYPYSFSAPKALSLVPLSQDQYDIYAISWNNQPADQNVLIGVDNLSTKDSLKQYIATSKRGYVENWWKQFGLKGVASITEFTNSKGLKGYRAKYINGAGQAPNDDVFLEATDPQYVIHVASGVLDASVFDPLVDSVAWKKQ